MAGIVVDEAMTKKPITASTDEIVMNIAETMKKNDIGSMLIVDGEKLVGIITSEDLIKRIILPKRDPEKTTAKEIMTTKLITVSPDDDLEDAVKIMIDNGIKRLPVVDDGKLVGILTDGDVMRISPKLIEAFSSKEFVEEPEVISDVCEICGNYSDNLRKVNGKWVCEECYESSSQI